MRLHALTVIAILAAASPAGAQSPVASGIVRQGTAARRCLGMSIVPGDTARTRMPHMAGDTLVDPRMPRATAAPPGCTGAGERVASARLVPRADSTGRRWWELLPAAGRDAPR